MSVGDATSAPVVMAETTLPLSRGADRSQLVQRRGPAILPVPKPLSSAIGRGHFGEDEHGPIRPTAAEVRAITENHAERLINLLEGLAEVEGLLANSRRSDGARLCHEKDRLLSAYQGAMAMYAEDFGEQAANRLGAYARHQFERR